MKLVDYVEKFGVRKSFMAKHLGVSDQSFRKYLLGLDRPPLELLYKIQDMTEGKVEIKDWLKTQDPQNQTPQ